MKSPSRRASRGRGPPAHERRVGRTACGRRAHVRHRQDEHRCFDWRRAAPARLPKGGWPMVIWSVRSRFISSARVPTRGGSNASQITVRPPEEEMGPFEPTPSLEDEHAHVSGYADEEPQPAEHRAPGTSAARADEAEQPPVSPHLGDRRWHACAARPPTARQPSIMRLDRRIPAGARRPPRSRARNSQPGPRVLQAGNGPTERLDGAARAR